jgi:hypothetical protein
MDAYELADELIYSGDRYMMNVGLMLRQQADRIAHLEMLVANRNEIIDKLDLTKPQIKELSDAEIRTIQDMCHLKNIGYNTFIMRFARAILKKASEK